MNAPGLASGAHGPSPHLELAVRVARQEVRAFAGAARRERRKQRRYCLHPRTAVSFGDGTLVRAHCRDISLGGAFLQAPVRPPFGAVVHVHIDLPLRNPERIVVESIVRWTCEEGFGVQFGVMGARATHALVELFQTASESPVAASRRTYFRASRARLQRYWRCLRALSARRRSAGV